MRQFLELVVENSLSSGTPLKESVIGTQVFGRAPDYDPGAEPIVRVEARRLRQKLEQYYLRDGANDPVVIQLPKGGYAAQFEFRTAVAVVPPGEAALPPRIVNRWWYAWIAIGACLLFALTLWIARSRPFRPAIVARPISSIAVLPLANLSGDPADEYLADGFTDELIGYLAKIPELRVISRTSAMQYKGAHKTLPQIAKELGVDAVVEGSVTRSGQQVRITAQLIDATQDRHLWSEDYHRPIGDMFSVESDVARAIAAHVKLALSSRQESRLLAQPQVSAEARDAYLKGRYYWNKRTEEGLRKSIDYFQEAVAKEPEYAQAWAGLADSWLLLGESWLRPNAEAFSESQKAVDRALALDDALGEAHASRAALASNRGQWEQADVEFRRAVELSPGYATAHQWYAEGLAAHGRSSEALAEIRRASELDPLSLPVNVQVGYVLFLARRYDEAIAQLRTAIDMDPSFWLAHADLGHVYEQKGMYEEAIGELGKAVDLTHGSEAQKLWLAKVWALAGRRAEARRVRDSLEPACEQGRVSPTSMALLDLALGDRDRAWARLHAACVSHSLGTISPTPLFDPLRADSKIAAMLAGCADR
jgi:TolB-like protein/Tfp pilus assembly protein PilF